MAKLPDNLKELQAANKLASLKLDTLRKQRAVALYDSAQKTSRRRSPKKETGGEEWVLPSKDRLQGMANVRDVERNFSNGRGISLQMKANTVGTLGKVRVNTPDGDLAAEWFNSVYAKECSARNDDHLSDIFQQILGCRFTGGDCIVLVDDGFRNDDGKIWMWEADQITDMKDGDFKSEYGAKGYTQEQGVVRDKFGVEVGYFVTQLRGETGVASKDITFLPRTIARLVKNPVRPNQGRGVADLLTATNDMFDMYDMRSREIQTAKLAATLAGSVKRDSATVDYDDPFASVGAGDAVTAGSGGVQAEQEKTYETFEALTGGQLEYMDAKDAFELFKIDRPNVNFEAFNDFVLGSAGFSIGLSRVYATGKASTSYTAFRGEQLMSWLTAYLPAQKWLERRVADWIAAKVFAWAVRKGVVSLAEGWQSRISWVWPTMPEVNLVDAANANRLRMQNGEMTLADIVGPDWKKKIDTLAEMNQYAKSKGVHLSTMDTISGAPIESTADADQIKTNANQKQEA